MAKAWYLYNRIDNFGAYPDPDGAFPKPDSNILCPDGTPITALGAGIVSGINTPGATGKVPSFGQVVTVLLYKAHNSLATHDAYLHLNSVNVSLGQAVTIGDKIGVSGPNPSGAAMGFAFYPGDNYGFGQEWNKYIQTPSNKADSRLDPVAYLDSVKANGPGSASDTGSPSANTGSIPDSTTSNNPLDSLTSGLTGLNTFFTNINSFFADPFRLIKIVLGTILVIAGIVLAIQQLKPVQAAEKIAA